MKTNTNIVRRNNLEINNTEGESIHTKGLLYTYIYYSRRVILYLSIIMLSFILVLNLWKIVPSLYIYIWTIKLIDNLRNYVVALSEYVLITK